MKVAILGGGPAGLYFSILLKASQPDCAIDLYERNRADDTFGFGVVFSDQTLDVFKKYDEESYRDIIDHFAYWDDIAIHFKGEVIKVGGNGFCGCSRRTLLQLLQKRASHLGVRLHFETEIIDESQFADYDLIVAADGINSRVRQKNQDHFRPEIDLRPNRFTWMGSTKPLDAFSFFFREIEHGVFIAHCYQYERGHSTWVIETDPQTWLRAGLDKMGETESALFLEKIFEKELDGHPLITNRSLWRQFPMIRNQRWVKGNIALMGDAKSTAHFSIGSGTKLAMEDAIALFNALQSESNVTLALAAYERDRRADVEKTQHAADVSLVWFEHVARFWDYDALKFAFGLMTRSKAITYDNLALRAPDFVSKVTRNFAEACGISPGKEVPPPLFQPLVLRDMEVRNRLVFPAILTYAAEQGMPTDWHLAHLGARALGGAGLVFTEMSAVSPEARVTPACPGLYSDEQEEAWSRIVAFIHAHSQAKVCMQLGHAGAKGAVKPGWQFKDAPLDTGAWPLVAPTPQRFRPESQMPREATSKDLAEIISDFVAAAKRADRASFDMLELQCGHGYLLGAFLSPLTNLRADQYGGELKNRLRFPLEVFRAVRAIWPNQKPMSVRISASDWKEGGTTDDEAVQIARAFTDAGCDLIDVSTGETVSDETPHYGRMYQAPYSDLIRNEVGVPTMTAGVITTADQANTILAAGRADLVAIGRRQLVDPSLLLRAAGWYGVEQQPAAPYKLGFDLETVMARRERAEYTELKLKARPEGGKVVLAS